MIETTYVMECGIIEMLEDAMEKTGLDRNELVVSAIEMGLQNHDEHVQAEGSIKYQARTPKGTKQRVHFRLGKMAYEFFQDMRKFFHKSISFTIAICLRKYLPIIVARILRKLLAKGKHNYPKYTYAIMRKCIKNNVFWLIYWGLPPG
jgi:hypothetical protein